MGILSDIIKAKFDMFIPRFREGPSSSNLRNSFIALACGDFLPLRPTTEAILESMDYGKDEGAAADWSGTGVTVSKDKNEQEDGLACLKAVIDSTGNRELKKASFSAIDISDFSRLGIKNKCDASSSAFQFLIRDSSGNESYWDITSHATPDTWEQASLGLSTPDSNNGTNADLSDVVQYGYKGLDADATYYFDTITAYLWAMKIYVGPSKPADFFMGVYVGNTRISFGGGVTPSMTAPTTNPRLDLISKSPTGTLTVTQGTETASPSDSDIPATPIKHIPVCVIYQKTTATKIVDYHQKDVYTNDSYIWKDLRPIYTGDGDRIFDKDGDTGIEVERTADDDTIYLKTAGTDRATIDANGLKLELGVSVKEFSTDGDLTDNSDAAVPTEKAVKSYVDTHGVPQGGGFIGWTGLLSNIPAGWALCDGNGGRPNLLDKFLKCVPNGSTDPGGTGGASTHTHGPGSYSVSGTTGNNSASENVSSTGSGLLVAKEPHTHPFSDSVSGNSASGSSLPPWYEVAWIMKV